MIIAQIMSLLRCLRSFFYFICAGLCLLSSLQAFCAENGGFEGTDYYGILGVDRSATADEIKQRFRALVQEHHPDKNPQRDTPQKTCRRLMKPMRC